MLAFPALHAAYLFGINNVRDFTPQSVRYCQVIACGSCMCTLLNAKQMKRAAEHQSGPGGVSLPRVKLGCDGGRECQGGEREHDAQPLQDEGADAHGDAAAPDRRRSIARDVHEPCSA